jgi:hypothetical protein
MAIYELLQPRSHIEEKEGTKQPIKMQSKLQTGWPDLAKFRLLGDCFPGVVF